MTSTCLQNEATALMSKGDDAAWQNKCVQSIRVAPQYPGDHYYLACALARHRKPAAMILQSCFTSVTAMAARMGLPGFLVRHPFRNDEVVASLSRIASMVDRTTHASREITEATRQQRAASDAVVAAMSTVTSASDRYREGSRRHAAAAAKLRDLATDLRNALGRFKVR